jgi:diguanylate cyclase (GGDEF)-like protein
MFSMVEYGHNVPVGSLFDTAELVPENYADGEKPAFLAFSPLYFKTRFLGYLAYEPSTLQGSGTLFETWITNISHNADSFYMNKALEYVIDELKNLYIRDPLTGLYNRRGMNLLGSELISEACRTGKDITVICADIDNLKPINDKFGHEGGDNTIIHTAKALEASMPDGSICVRTGGDEFCVLFSGNTDAADCIKAMEKYLDDYNKNSGLPYCISCSCGFARITGAKFESVDPIMKAADENMYKVKAAKKTARR